jgi:hypothetical protein
VGGVEPGSGSEDGLQGSGVAQPEGARNREALTARPARKRRRRVLLGILVVLVLLGGAGGLAAWLPGALPANHRSPWSADGVAAVSPAQPTAGRLAGVAVVSSSSAWAVGASCNLCMAPGVLGRTLIVHWHGTTWSRVRSPSPGVSANLTSVTAGRGSGTWAVGGYCPSGCSNVSGAAERVLIMRWDGSTWSRVASPSPGVSGILAGVISGPPDTVLAAGWECVRAA